MIQQNQPKFTGHLCKGQVLFLNVRTLKQPFSLISAITQIGLELPPDRPPMCLQMRECNGDLLIN